MADVKSVYDEMMADYVKSVRIDGFRKGHVPPSVLERKFGDSLRLEAMSRVLEKAVDAALADAEEKPLAYEAPALEGEPEFALDKDFSFSVTYDVFPHFELPSTEGIELEVPGVEVSEEDLAQELERIRERNAIVVEKTGEAALGDIVTVAYSELTEDGREVAGSKREDFTFELGKGLNLYKFDEEVVGMKAGDSKIFPKTYPGDFEYKDLAGKTVMLSVAVSKVKQKDVPALDDELAQDVSEKYKTLEDLKKAVREQLQSALDNRLRSSRKRSWSISSGENQHRCSRIHGLRRTVDALGVAEARHGHRQRRKNGKHRPIFRQESAAALRGLETRVGKAIAGRLLLDKLVEKSGLEITEEDLSAEYARQAEGSAMSVENESRIRKATVRRVPQGEDEGNPLLRRPAGHSQARPGREKKLCGLHERG
jgi:trigger factor